MWVQTCASSHSRRLAAHTETLRAALSATDIIISTGGTSMGSSDLLKPVIERELGGTVHFGRVKVKPGKPTTFATVPVQGEDGRAKPVFALPGCAFYASALIVLMRRGQGILHRRSCVSSFSSCRRFGGSEGGSIVSAICLGWASRCTHCTRIFYIRE